MITTQKLFFSCVEYRLHDHGGMYGRFHLGTFVQGQALTLGNALRRILLSEIPGVGITNVVIEGAVHEFASLPGVKETVLEILLNLQNLVFSACNCNLRDLEDFESTVLLKSRGPARLTGADLKLPITIKCLNPNAHIATLTTGEEFSLRLELSVRRPQKSTTQIQNSRNSFDLGGNNLHRRPLGFDSVPMPVQKVNYVIKSINAKQGSEYLVLEVWTDGSILPQEAVQFSLKHLTQMFYQFSFLSK